MSFRRQAARLAIVHQHDESREQTMEIRTDVKAGPDIDN
jgi:hypothetical protein